MLVQNFTFICTANSSFKKLSLSSISIFLCFLIHLYQNSSKIFMKHNIVPRLDGLQRGRRTDRHSRQYPEGDQSRRPYYSRGCTLHLSTILSKACQQRKALVAKDRCASPLTFYHNFKAHKKI